MKASIDQANQVWKTAAAFPADKERVYPEHAKAHEFDLHTGKDVWEYGCGGGSDAMSWMRRGNRVTYSDILAFNVGAAMQRIATAGLSGTPVVLEDSAPLPAPDASFDVVSSHGVLHHIATEEMRDRVMSEFYRILRPGGVVYIMLYTEHLRARLDLGVTQLVTWRGMTEEAAFCQLTDSPGCPYAIPFTEEKGWAYLEKAGFTRVNAMLYNSNDFRTFKAMKVPA